MNYLETQLEQLSSDDFIARWMVAKNKVQLLSNLQVFNNGNENNQVYVVKLHPESRKKGCSHIKAALLSTGKEPRIKGKKITNLTRLRSNYTKNKK